MTGERWRTLPRLRRRWRSRSPEPDKTHRDWHDITSLSILGATFIAAVLAAVFTGRQAYLANKQLRVARDVLSVTRDQERRQLRAYVSIMGKDTTEHLDVGQKPEFTLDVKNTGSTPAFNISTGGKIIVLPYPLPGALNMVPQKGVPNSRTALFPGATNNIPLEGDVITADDAKNLKGPEPKYRIYFLAHVEYDDIWGERHYTHFCMRTVPIVATSQHPEYCEQYNDAD